jgi:protein-S-isoprenylcysteine O-methyltransferase Ste14
MVDMSDDTSKKEKQKIYMRAILGVVLTPVIMLVFVFGAAGRFEYWQGWGYTILNVFVVIITILLFAKRTEFVKERLSPGKGMKQWDRAYYALSTPLFFVTIILASADVGRFGWTSMLPFYVYVLSYVLFLFGNALFLWAKRTNQFFSSVVRIQTDRNQQVCQVGPYRFVRHPGYVGGFLFALVTPVVLGSLWALIPAVMSVLLLIIRTYLEDITLQKELPGYVDYTKKVKYRLFHGVW